MKKWMLGIIIAVSLVSLSYGFEVVDSSGYKFVKVSLKDVNRIVCPVAVGNVVYSKEKQMQVSIQGRNVFVKFIPVQKVDPETGAVKYVYSKIPRDIYIECGGKYFSLILIPQKKYTARTIILRLPMEDVKKASAFEKANSYEKTIMTLVKSAYLETPPPGYVVSDVNKPVKKEGFQKVRLYLRRVMKGAHFVVSEYIVEAREDVSLDETQFLDVEFHPLAISIVQPVLAKGQSTRMFIVTSSEYSVERQR